MVYIQIVKLFQTRNVDRNGMPLVQDGKIGSLTWEALFGADSVTEVAASSDSFLGSVMKIAVGEEAKKIREVPPDSNKGPAVEGYLSRAGVAKGNPWCCAFVYWCFDEAAKKANRANPMLKTAHCMTHWNKCTEKGAKRISKKDAEQNPGLLKPGMIFIMDHGGGKGHTGLIEKVSGGMLTTIEGNTNASKTREGGGVYRLTRKVGTINRGFIDYSGV